MLALVSLSPAACSIGLPTRGTGDHNQTANAALYTPTEAAHLRRAVTLQNWDDGGDPSRFVASRHAWRSKSAPPTERHIVAVGQVQRWTEGAAVSPAEGPRARRTEEDPPHLGCHEQGAAGATLPTDFHTDLMHRFTASWCGLVRFLAWWRLESQLVVEIR